jgi:hypothetical protein
MAGVTPCVRLFREQLHEYAVYLIRQGLAYGKSFS